MPLGQLTWSGPTITLLSDPSIPALSILPTLPQSVQNISLSTRISWISSCVEIVLRTYPAPGWRAIALGSSRPSSISTTTVPPDKSETEMVSVPARENIFHRLSFLSCLCLSSRDGCRPSPPPGRQPSPRSSPPPPTLRGSRSLSGPFSCISNKDSNEFDTFSEKVLINPPLATLNVQLHGTVHLITLNLEVKRPNFF